MNKQEKKISKAVKEEVEKERIRKRLELELVGHLESDEALSPSRMLDNIFRIKRDIQSQVQNASNFIDSSLQLIDQVNNGHAAVHEAVFVSQVDPRYVVTYYHDCEGNSQVKFTKNETGLEPSIVAIVYKED